MCGGHTALSIPHKPAKKEALRVSRRGPPSASPCSLLLQACSRPRDRHTQRRADNVHTHTKKKNKHGLKIMRKKKKPTQNNTTSSNKAKRTPATEAFRRKEPIRVATLPRLLPVRQGPRLFWFVFSLPRLGSWLMYSKLSCKLNPEQGRNGEREEKC